MSHNLGPTPVETNILKRPVKWIDDRLPIFTLIKSSLGTYPTPKNLNYLWSFGSLAGIALVIQVLTGIFLAMHYKPDVALAFNSVQHIMRNVGWGWLLRDIHMVGASFFFMVVYLHIARGLYYGSYKKPRELLWIIGILIFLTMMATAFMGYVLPWGQMSYWGATVITNLLSVIPFVGNGIVVWLWGGFSVGDPTLTRFYALHFLLPFVLMAIVMLHLWALHTHKSNNPAGIDLSNPDDFIPFHPYYTIKDIFSLGVYLIPFSIMVFFLPDFLGNPDNFTPANPIVTPPHIVPEWYFLPFYAILRGIPLKWLGVLAMFSSIVVLFFLPWLDTSPVRSARYRPIYKQLFWILLADFAILGWVGAHPPEGLYVVIARVCTVIYFGFFALLPWVSKVEKPHPVPKSL
jgi:ubiquinol-cytochrome c reductase cytochrome b subunit